MYNGPALVGEAIRHRHLCHRYTAEDFQYIAAHPRASDGKRSHWSQAAISALRLVRSCGVRAPIGRKRRHARSDWSGAAACAPPVLLFSLKGFDDQNFTLPSTGGRSVGQNFTALGQPSLWSRGKVSVKRSEPREPQNRDDRVKNTRGIFKAEAVLCRLYVGWILSESNFRLIAVHEVHKRPKR
eukprot:1183533-Prorocentrum_minimum.AAC.2